MACACAFLSLAGACLNKTQVNSKNIEITGKEIKEGKEGKDINEYKDNALAYGKKLQGEYTNKDTGNTILLQRGRKNGGIKEVLQHDYKDAEHLQSIAAIPQIIENSIYVDSEQNRDLEKNPNVAEYQYYVVGLNIGGVDYTVRSTIAIDKNGDRYYDHKLTQIEKGKLLDLSGRVTNPAINQAMDILANIGDKKRNPSISEYKDTKLISILQNNSSKVVDQNGEPMVVYHATQNNFTIFDKSKSGKNIDFGTLGIGFYFTSSKENAKQYAKNIPLNTGKYGGERIIDAFLNIRNIYDAELLREVSGDDKKQSQNYTKNKKTKGYDGVKFEWRNDFIFYNAFNPNQIKSATDNNGNFDETEGIYGIVRTVRKKK